MIVPGWFELRETAALVRRQPVKFTKNTARAALLAITGIAPAAGPCYLFFRIVDDMADGEREVPAEFGGSFENFVAVAEQMVTTSSPPQSSDLLALMMRAIAMAERREIRLGEVRQAFCGFLAAMRVEYRRRVERQIFSAAELIKVHTESSRHAHQLGLIVLGSRNRAEDTPALAELIGRSDALRDLHRDLKLGIVNLPAEILDSDVQFAELVRDPHGTARRLNVRRWIEQETAAIRHRATELTFARLDLRGALMLATNAGKRCLW